MERSATTKCLTILLASLEKVEEEKKKEGLVEVFWKSDFALEDFLIDGHGVLVRERVDSGIHFVNEDAKSPPICRLSMACENYQKIGREPTFIQEDFRGQILRRAA